MSVAEDSVTVVSPAAEPPTQPRGTPAPAGSLDRFFRPRSIALVGASERSVWAVSAYENLRRFRYAGALHLVNHKGAVVFGRSSSTSCRAIGERIDTALLMVPDAAIPAAIEDLHAAGATGAVILSAGFAETGRDGALRQAEIKRLARAAGIRLLGPNCLGFVNFVDNTPLWTMASRRATDNASLAIVSQSGATAGQMAVFAHQQRIGLTYLISTGNEVDIDISQVVEHLADDPPTRAIALFIETVRDPVRFTAAVQRARARGKVVVALKVGRSEATAQAAQAHTGALVGDDRVFDAVCQRLGIPRVDSIEDLVITADVLARLGPIERGGVGLVAMSGGMCEIAADQAECGGASIPALTPETRDRLRQVLPAMATAHNPLDITGAAMLEPELLGKALAVLRQDAGLGVVACLFDAPASADAVPWADKVIGHIAQGFKGEGARGLLLSHAMAPVSKEGAEVVARHGLIYSGAGLHHGFKALAALAAWSRSVSCTPTVAPVSRSSPAPATRPVGERATLAYLADRCVPVIATALATSEQDAVRAAGEMDGPVALKISSPQIAHKTEVGGVALDLSEDDAVRVAWRTMMQRVREARPDAQIEGALVVPMRRGGVELLVGTMNDPQWGPVIAVGLGGIWVEALQDSSLRLLPVSLDDALEMLDELRGVKLLDGYRGAPPVDRTAVARAVVAIGEAALALGPQLASLEINPLRAQGDRVEALDALLVWKDTEGASIP